MSDEGLRQAYARAVDSRAPGERTACPAPEAILALVQRAGDEEQRLTLLDHVMACPACTREFELLRAIERAGENETAAGRVVGHISWRRWAPLAAAAAVVLLLLGPGRRVWQPSPGAVRGSADTLVLAAPANDAAPAERTVAFAWHPAPGAQRYTLELLTSGGGVVLSRTTTDTALTLTVPAALAPGDYRWWVTATAADGSATRSGTRTLRLRGR